MGTGWNILIAILASVGVMSVVFLGYLVIRSISAGSRKKSRAGNSAVKKKKHETMKEDGITNQRVTIHYNCIGAFEVPDRRKIPERDILLETRKGVALSYAPAQIAI